jgi:hypothetical protein
MNAKERDQLLTEIDDAVKQRAPWEERQTKWYQLRHNGLRRQNKPWPNAADLHFPLIDTQIEKLKPLFMQQAFGMDVVASFTPMRSQLSAYTTTAESWFNYKIREKTNLSDEILSWVDWTLMSGRGVIKCFWNNGDKRVEFDAIDPNYFLVPTWATDVQSSDWMVHVMPMSVAAYRRTAAQRGWDDSDSTVKAIRGGPQDGNIRNSNSEANEKQLREGITYTSNTDQLIVWEVYRKTDDGKWEVCVMSPAQRDKYLRDPMELPYDHGQAPFIDFPYEIKDKGWYSPRGVAEILAAYELSLTALWNNQHDAMALFNKPLFRAEREIPNSINLRFKPGQILPYGVAPAPMPQPPISIGQEMQVTRAVAEQRIGSPDYGITSLTGGSDRRTATEVQSINAMSMQSGDLRARLFRMSLSKLYKQAWGLLLQYDSKSLRYRFAEDSMDADPVALHDQYELEPKGGLDMVSRQSLMQQAMQRKQLYANSPWIDQRELDKSILAVDDPSLIKRLFIEPTEKQQNELEDESRIIPTLMVGIPVPAKRGQDYAGRIGVLMQYLNGIMQQGIQLPPMAANAFMQRLDSLLAAYEQVATNEARKLRKEIQGFLENTGMIPSKKQMAAQGQPVPQVQSPQPQQQPIQG